MADDLLRIGYSPSYIPQTFDYTSRDYYAIRDHLIEVVKTRIPEWTGEDPSDFGLALVEAMAYLGDLMSYYIDRAGNEAFLPTATRRQSVINIARMLGYTPGRAVAAKGTVTLSGQVPAAAGTYTWASNSVTVTALANHGLSVGNPVSIGFSTGAASLLSGIYTVATVPNATTFTFALTGSGTGGSLEYAPCVPVPARTLINAKIRRDNGVDDVVQFTTDTAVTVPASGSVDVAVTEGYVADSAATGNHGVLLGVSDGTAEQTFDLPYTPVAAGTLEVYVFDGVAWTLWNEVTHIIEYTALDNIYEAILNADGSVTIKFGDGVTGRIPPITQQIAAKYRVGGGERGNIPAGTIVNIEDSGIDVNVNVTNAAATYGGTNEESTFSVRENAALGFRANRRAVSKTDIETLTRNVPGVYAASANAAVWSNITLAIAPNYDGSLSPGLTGTVGTDVITGAESSQLTTLKADVKSALDDLLMFGATLTLRNPEYAKVKLGLTVTLVDTASQKYATTHITEILEDGPLSFERRGFGGGVTMADIITAITTNTSYVTGVVVNDLYRKDSGFSAGVHTTTAAWYEILILDADNDLTLDFAGTGTVD